MSRLARARQRGEAGAVRNNAWLTYLPQAGVTLGLVLIAADALPDLAVPLRQAGMAVVAINLLIGPVLMSTALRRAGEVPGAATSEAAGAEEASTRPALAVSGSEPQEQLDIPESLQIHRN